MRCTAAVVVRITRAGEGVASGTHVHVDIFDDAVESLEVVDVVAGCAQRPDRVNVGIQIDLDSQSVADDDGLAITIRIRRSPESQLIPQRKFLGASAVFRIEVAVREQIFKRQVVIDRQCFHFVSMPRAAGVVGRTVGILITQRQNLISIRCDRSPCDTGRSFLHTFPVKFDNDFIHEAFTGLEQRDRSEPQIDADPEKCFKKDRKLAFDVEHTLDAMPQTIDQLPAVELAVAHWQIIDDQCLKVVQVEVDRRFQTATHTSFDKSANP